MQANLHHISRLIDRVDHGELGTLELKVLLHSRDIGLGNVGSVEVIPRQSAKNLPPFFWCSHEICQTAKCQNKDIKLEHQLRLQWRPGVAPEVLVQPGKHLVGLEKNFDCVRGSQCQLLSRGAVISSFSCPRASVLITASTRCSCEFWMLLCDPSKEHGLSQPR